VSLLLDALKRAEREKQAQPPEERDGRGPHLVTPGKPALELQPVAPETPAPATRSPSQAAALALAPAAPRKRRAVLWVVAAAVVLVILGTAGYVWYSLDQLQPRPAARPARLPPVAAAPPPVVESAVPAQVASPTPEARPVAAPPAAPAATAPPPGRAPSVEAVVAQPAVLQPSRAAQRPRVPPEVQDGYDALRRGELAKAKRSYAAAIANDPANLDALLGLATVEARGGSREAAAALYRRALDVDPRNASALAGLAALAEGTRPEALEARLLRDLAEQPGSAALQFMLGNLYASEGRWGEAQSAFFEAHRIEPANSEVLYNLAVSLDHLGQGRTAAGFYRKALEAGNGQAVTFDAAAVTRRLGELEPR